MSSTKRIVIGSDGYFSSQSPLTTPQGALVSPSENMIYRENGILESFGGFTNINSQGDERAYTLEDGWGIIGGGNVIESFGRCLLFVGSGTLKVLLPVVSSSVQTIGSASSIPQISVLSGGSYLAPRKIDRKSTH